NAVIAWMFMGALAVGCGRPLEGDPAGSDPRDPQANGGAGARGSGVIAACGAEVDLAAAPSVAPPAAGQRYVRCATLGPEVGWNVVLSPESRRLAARTAAGAVRLLDTATWREVALLVSPLGRMDAVAFSPDSATVATLAAEMGQVALWRASDGKLDRTFAGPPASTIDAWA